MREEACLFGASKVVLNLLNMYRYIALTYPQFHVLRCKSTRNDGVKFTDIIALCSIKKFLINLTNCIPAIIIFRLSFSFPTTGYNLEAVAPSIICTSSLILTTDYYEYLEAVASDSYNLYSLCNCQCLKTDQRCKRIFVRVPWPDSQIKDQL